MEINEALETDKQFKISLLGPPVITWQGNRLVLPRRQARQLLYRLSFELQPVSRDNLSNLFWPEVGDSAGRQNLSRLLSYTHQSLPHPDLVVTGVESVALARNLVWSDSETFLKLTQSDASLSMLAEAAALYRGPLLDGTALGATLEYEQWLREKQRQCEQCLLATLNRLIEAETDLGQLETAVAYAQKYLTVDELAEDVHRRLITLYHHLGNRSAAQRQFERCVLVLERELGVQPLPETRAAYEASRIEKPVWQGRPSVAATVTILPSLDLPLLGRQKAWAQLEEACRHFQTGGFVLISGESGNGKSRLLQEFIRSRQQPAIVGSAHSGSRTLPYQPIVQALRHALAEPVLWQGIPLIWRSELRPLLPEMVDHFGDLVEPLTVAPEQTRQRIFEALTQTCIGFARHASLLLCLEDLHWSDEDTLQWLTYMAPRLAGSGLILIATCRHLGGEPLLPLRRALRRQSLLVDILLSGLEVEAISVLLQQVPQGPAEPRPLAERLHSETGGNPFFILEIVRTLMLRNELAVPPELLPLPSTVEEMIQGRLARLTPLVRQIVETTAVSAPTIDVDVVQRVAGRPELEVVEALDELVAQQLLRLSESGYAFCHELIRTAVYESLTPSRRRLLHRRTAEALAVVYSDEPIIAAQVAQHYHKAGEAKQAFHHYRQAAITAQAIYANEAALTHWQQAIDLLPRTRQPERIAAELHESLGDILYLMGKAAAARKAFAFALAVLGNDHLLDRAILECKLGNVAQDQGQVLEADEHYGMALQLLESTRAESPLWQSVWLDVQLDRLELLYLTHDMDQLEEKLAQLRPIIEEHGSPLQRYKLAAGLAQFQLTRQRFRLSVSDLSHAYQRMEAARETDERHTIEQARFALGLHLLCADRPAEAQTHLQQARAKAADLGDLALQTRSTAYLSVAHRRQGQKAEAGAAGAESICLAEKAELRFYLGVGKANVAWVDYRAGRRKQAVEQAYAAIELWTPLYPFQWLGWWLVLAWHLERDNLDQAVAAAAAMLGPEQQQLREKVTADLETAVATYATGEIATSRHSLTAALEQALVDGYL